MGKSLVKCKSLLEHEGWMLLLGLGGGPHQKPLLFFQSSRCAASQPLTAGSWVSQEVLPAFVLCVLLGHFWSNPPSSLVTLRGSPAEGSPVCTVS